MAARHDFVILVPVADRPLHLAHCLGSLAELLQRYPYEGRVSALIVDDSAQADNIARHAAIVADFAGRGLDVHHLDQPAQRALIAVLPADVQAGIAGIVGRADAESFGHKGAAVTRNLAYLWLNALPEDGRKRLFWSLDSDQEFRVNLDGPDGETLDCAVDYLHALDRIFSTTPTQILTGKVVGDPPVSPAVMAGTFLDDVLGFLDEMTGLDPAAPCTFHGRTGQGADDASYHDMADLFGFQRKQASWRYRCPLDGVHDHAACCAEFASHLNRFFDGEHPTRRSHYVPDDPLASVKPARTLYTGNYIFTPAALEWFVPFAALRLRMAGPTLGRILRAQLGERFVSANLPMLHRRTVVELGQSECRPGVERADERVDLSGEFERQYFGDVMLFAMERLTELGYPDTELAPEHIAATLDDVEAGLRQRYLARQAETRVRIDQLAARLDAVMTRWQRDGGETWPAFRRFLDDMRHNFGTDSAAWQSIGSPHHQASRKSAILDAIRQYRRDRASWQAALGRGA